MSVLVAGVNITRFFPHHLRAGRVRANDNAPGDGGFGTECQALQKRWGLDDAQIYLWIAAMGSFSSAVIAALEKQSLAVCEGGLRHERAIFTAAAMGLVSALFAMIKELPQHESVFVLEEVSRLTDELVQHGGAPRHELPGETL